jgi:hypothetical protein
VRGILLISAADFVLVPVLTGPRAFLTTSDHDHALLPSHWALCLLCYLATRLSPLWNNMQVKHSTKTNVNTQYVAGMGHLTPIICQGIVVGRDEQSAKLERCERCVAQISPRILDLPKIPLTVSIS